MNTDFHTLEKEFREELQAIREALDQLGHEPELADWQKSSSDARRRVMQSLNQSAEALNVWDEIGVPIRRRGNTVFRIWAPRDVMGSPIIKALPADAFAIGAAEQTATDRIEIDRLKKLFENWRIAAIILAIILALIAARWIF